MFRRMDDFMNAYDSLKDGTAKIFDKLTDENIKQPVSDGFRTLGQIAWHIVATVPEMIGRTGLGVSSVDSESPPPESAAEIAAAYETVSSELIKALEAGWDDETLEVVDEMYGEQWPRGLTLSILIDHEIHHRGQMTVLLRQAGERVPGIFGPAKEEWGQFGMETPPY